MSESRTIALYVHKCKALERENDRLRAVHRHQRELMEVYADGWRAASEEIGREPTEFDGATEEALARCEDDAVRLTQQLDELRAENAALLNQIREHRQEAWKLADKLRAAEDGRDEWKAEALNMREQIKDLSRQVKELHGLHLAIAGVEENHRDG